jgi:hypothetical protein
VTSRNVQTLLGTPVGIGTGQPDDGLPGSGRSGPRGIESVIEYNGLYLNVRDWVDTYLVTQIGGLDDADIRDSREVNPGFHGETAFMSFYGGRTITLTGKIYCKTLFKLRDMQQALRQAFAQLDEERPLIFRTPDPNLDMMLYCKKSQQIQMLDEQRTANHFERAFQITLRAGNPRFLSVLQSRDNIAFTNIREFFPSSVQTVENFADAGVLTTYNEKGAGFAVSGGFLSTANKSGWRNIITEPDFDVQPTRVSAVNGTMSIAPLGGVGDDEQFGIVTSTGGNYCSLKWTVPSMQTGQAYSALCHFRSSRFSRFAQIMVEWLDSNNVVIGSQLSEEEISDTSEWKQIRLTGAVAPAGTVRSNWHMRFNSPAIGEEHHVDRMMVVPGSTFPPDGYFDGDSPLAKWVLPQGTTNLVPNPSNELVNTFGSNGAATATPINLITNPSFEGDTVGATPSGYSVYPSQSIANLVRNPSFEDLALGATPTATQLSFSSSSSSPVQFGVNYVKNPAAGVDATWWEVVAASATLERHVSGDVIDTDTVTGIPFGSTFFCLRNITAGAATYCGAETNSTDRIPVTPGVNYVASAYVRHKGGLRQSRIEIVWLDAAGAQISLTSPAFIVPGTPNVWTRLAAAAVAPANAVTARVRVYPISGGGTWTGDDAYFTNVLFIAGTTDVTVPYYDGTMTGFQWSGTPHASTSLVSAASAIVTNEWVRPVGTKSIRYRTTRNDGAAVVARTPIGLDGFPVVGGKTYAARASLRLRAIVGNTPIANSISIRFYWYTAAGAAASTSVSGALDVRTPGALPWSADLEASAAAPADAAFASIALHFDRAVGTELQYYVDADVDNFFCVDMTGLPATPIPPYFDGDYPGFQYSGTPYASSSTPIPASLVVDNNWARPAGYGTNSARYRATRNDNGTANLAAVSPQVAVTAGKTYGCRLSTRIRANAGALKIPKDVHLRAFFYTAAQAVIGGSVALTGSPVTPVVANGSYNLSGTVVAPANAAFMTVFVQFSNATDPQWGVDADVDHVMIVDMLTYTAIPAYFDGSLGGWKWSGTANASTSLPNAVRTRTQDWAEAGTWSCRYQATQDNGGSGHTIRLDSNGSPNSGRIAVNPLRYYAFRCRVRMRSTSGPMDGVSMQIVSLKSDNSTATATRGTIYGPEVVNPAPNAEYDVLCIYKPPSDAAFVAIRPSLNFPANLVSTADFDFDAVAMFDLGENFGGPVETLTNPADVPPYIDGDQSGSVWDGAAHASTSSLILAEDQSDSLLPSHSVLTTPASYTYPISIAKIIAPATVPTKVVGEIRHVVGVVNEDNQLYAAIQTAASGNAAQMAIYVIKNGKKLVVAGPVNVTIAANNTCFFRAWLKTGVVFAEFDNTGKDPTTAPDWNPTALSYALDYEEKVTFGDLLSVQLVVLDEGLAYKIDEWRYGTIDDMREWRPLLGAGTTWVKNDRLYPLNRSPKLLVRDDLPYKVGNGTLTMKIRYDDPIATGDTMDVGIAGKILDDKNFMTASISRAAPAAASTTTLTLERRDTVGTLAAATTPVTATDFPEDTDRWLRLVMNNDAFTAEFWLTDPALGGAARAVAGPFTLTGADKTKFGVGVKGDVGIAWDAPRPLTQWVDNVTIASASFDDTAFFAYNEGNFPAQPKIELIGPLTNPIISNGANGEVLGLVAGTTIPNGEVWVIDIAARRMYRQSDNANRFQYLDVNSDWLELEPGENRIDVTASGLAVASQVNVIYNHTVM